MNENTDFYPASPRERTQTAEHWNDSIRENPLNSLLVAVGIGLVAALLFKAARPAPPISRLQRLLEELEDRVGSVSKPAARRASSLAEDGAKLFESTRGDVETAFSRAFRDGRRQWQRFFN